MKNEIEKYLGSNVDKKKPPRTCATCSLVAGCRFKDPIIQNCKLYKYLHEK